MLPIAPLMIEHRLIERVIGLMQKEFDSAKQKRNINTDFIEVAVDFMKTFSRQVFKDLLQCAQKIKNGQLPDKALSLFVVRLDTVSRKRIATMIFELFKLLRRLFKRLVLQEPSHQLRAWVLFDNLFIVGIRRKKHL